MSDRTVTPTIAASDALAAGQTMRALAAMDRCGSPQGAALFARVGAQLLAAARVELDGADVAARVIRGDELSDAEALAFARVMVDAASDGYESHATVQLAKALIRAREEIGNVRARLVSFGRASYEAERQAERIPGHKEPPAKDTTTTPVCSTCSDTHWMDLRGDAVPCTHCPVPCQSCRERLGAYCAATPCSCACHRRTPP